MRIQWLNEVLLNLSFDVKVAKMNFHNHFEIYYNKMRKSVNFANIFSENENKT